MSTFLAYDAFTRVLQRVHDSGGTVPVQAGFAANLSPLQLTEARAWRRQLAFDISWAYTAWRCLPDWSSNSRSRKRVEQLLQVSKLAERLQMLVENDDLPLAGPLGNHLEFPLTVGGIIAHVQNLGEAATMEVARLSKMGLDNTAPLNSPVGDEFKGTPGSEFIRHMADAYAEAFGVEPAVSYDQAREPGGPFVEFVLVCLREVAAAQIDEGVAEPDWPITDTSQAVAKAFDRWRRASSDKDQ